MHFSTVAIAAFAALPTFVSAFTLGQISDPIGEVNAKCASQFNIPLFSCPILPGKCSEACEEQLTNLAKTLKGVCTGDPQGLLLIALSGDLVKTLCTGGNTSNGGNNGGNSQPSPVASQTSGGVTFQVAPGKTAEPTPGNSDLNFSGGIVQVTSAGSDQPAPTGLVIDTSVPGDATQAVAFPSYTPTTLETTSNPTSTESAGGNSNSNNNGGPFTSQEDMPNSASAIRAGLMGLTVGFAVVIVNIA